MNFSGTIDEGSGMTMTRLIERIVHTDTPGELRLHDDVSGRRATVAIRRGMVQDVAFGGLAGDPALTAISHVTPWTFEFVSDEAGAVPAHPGIVPRKPKARPVIRAASAAETKGQAQGGNEGMRDEVATSVFSIPPSPVPSVPPSLTESHRSWINAPASPYCIRFGAAGADFAGEVVEEDHVYFRSDFAFLRSTAGSIARSLGWPDPTVFAIVEAERATGYSVTGEGFLGIIGGAGTGVSHVTDFPPA